MKKLTICGLVLLTLALSACHSTTESEIVSDSTEVKSIDTISVINDSIEIVDSLKK